MTFALLNMITRKEGNRMSGRQNNWNEAGQNTREDNRIRVLKLLYAFYAENRRAPKDAKELVDAAKKGGVTQINLREDEIQKHLDVIFN